MSTILSVIAIIAALASVVLNLIIYDHNSRAQDAEASKSLPSNTWPAIAIPPPPKTNDKRIVRKSDGKYYIQYFWDIPVWFGVTDGRYCECTSAASSTMSSANCMAQP